MLNPRTIKYTNGKRRVAESGSAITMALITVSVLETEEGGGGECGLGNWDIAGRGRCAPNDDGRKLIRKFNF